MRLSKLVKKAIKGRLAPVDGPLMYNQDGLATRHNCDVMRDENFVRAYHRQQPEYSFGQSRSTPVVRSRSRKIY